MSTLLEDLTSGDAHRIWAGSCAVAKLRDRQELDLLSAHLPEIEKKTQNIDLGGALFPNREHLRFALRKLHYYRSKAGCLCRLYPGHLMFDPAKEEAAGNVRIVETIDADQYNPSYVCQCAFCDTLFQVEEGEYHYTWWKWSLKNR
jgi:hypothetical protein